MDLLNSVLGKFYFLEHNRLSPTFVQIVGWTKKAEEDVKRRYVYVRKVPLIIERGNNGGQWSFDHSIIKKYKMEIIEPVHNRCDVVDANAILIDEVFLRYNGITLQQRVFSITKTITCLESEESE